MHKLAIKHLGRQQLYVLEMIYLPVKFMEEVIRSVHKPGILHESIRHYCVTSSTKY